jgi:hypothetical protein
MTLSGALVAAQGGLILFEHPPAWLVFSLTVAIGGLGNFLGTFGRPLSKKHRVDKGKMPPSPPSPPSLPPPHARSEAAFTKIEWLLFIASGLLFIFCVLFLSGCAGARAATYGSLEAMVKSATLARTELVGDIQDPVAHPGACERAQNLAVDAAKTPAEAEQARKTNLARCRAAKRTLDSVVEVCASARDEVRDFDPAHLPEAVLHWAHAAATLYENVNAVLAPFGVKLPPGGR